MNYNPRIHHRHSIRLKGYDYSRAGLYFITICVQDRLCLFGCIENGKIVMNDSGNMIKKWYFEMENKFPDKRCHEMIIMPNYIHFILENMKLSYNHSESHDGGMDPNRTQTDAHVPGTDAHVPGTDAHVPGTDAHEGASLRGRPDSTGEKQFGIHNKKYGATICESMDWFKTMTTNEYIRGVKQYGWPRFNGKLWQRNYYEHIIRDEKSHRSISLYIINNPAKWDKDRFNLI